ncbi:hypothetical protein [Amycolatopsis echigonensis]|uniref:Lipoprotein n=1 Tax=Amycolatopsis echigonensis TaxID=2576905 RepID=A0A8E2BAC2_9PSEU|nr:hypothetical protein [Amycolatopsis echigonensis]MBB2506342.1 hypothetical protein [Amycolatopsis echigonensis]
MNNVRNKVLLTATGIAALAAVASCGLGASVEEKSNGHVKAVSYDTGKQGKANPDARLPSWVPDDAKSVTELIRTTGSERILRYQPGLSGLPELCKPGKAEAKAPTLTADWWPAGEHKRMDKDCGGWHVAVEADGVFAYQAETVANADK